MMPSSPEVSDHHLTGRVRPLDDVASPDRPSSRRRVSEDPSPALTSRQSAGGPPATSRSLTYDVDGPAAQAGE